MRKRVLSKQMHVSICNVESEWSVNSHFYALRMYNVFKIAAIITTQHHLDNHCLHHFLTTVNFNLPEETLRG